MFSLFEFAVWTMPLESVRWNSFSHKTFKDLEKLADTYRCFCTARCVRIWKEKYIIVQDSCWSVHLQDKPQFWGRAEHWVIGGLEMAPGCQRGRKAKGEWLYNCAPHHPGATFYCSISKIVLGISVLDVAAYWDKADGTLIARFFSQYSLNLAIVACAATSFCLNEAHS